MSKNAPACPDYAHENLARAQGFIHICGIDEAGRGPLAGPVCAAAVVLPEDCDIPGLNDSKKLSENTRKRLFDIITAQAADYSIAFASAGEIDSVNILQATFLAMRRAVSGLKKPPDFALVDGNLDPALSVPVECIVGGDGKSASIAAASVLAKVSRDRLLREFDVQYPGYGFAKHKGYGTKAHYAALAELGLTPEHRRSFLRKILGA
ncbi:MAG: ribonuclease HII [Oscillospiraceae bacterium]|jgi:ribonuclease HII|nr:ribonuclease HII [Oscillospiraceae bacterium]